MRVKINLPKSGMGIEEGTVVKWLKAVGEPVEKGEVLIEVETAKAIQEVRAPASGTLAEIRVAEGGTAPVNTSLGAIERVSLQRAALASLFDLTGRSALVTGGAMGLGRACAEILAAAGANVAIVDLNQAVGEHTAASIRACGVDSLFVRCDVADRAQVEAMTAAVIARFGRLDIGVNNAGYGLPEGGSETLDLAAWERVLAVNLTGVFLCAQAQARQMMAQSPAGGKIINTASMYGIIAGGNVAYNTSKAGVIHLTHSLAAEWGRYNINVNCISPSWTLTPAMLEETPPEVRRQIREVTPMGHVQRPEDIQGPVLFLASRASDFVTGHNLVVDGGHTLNTWFKPFTPLARTLAPRVAADAEAAEALKDAAVIATLRGKSP